VKSNPASIDEMSWSDFLRGAAANASKPAVTSALVVALKLLEKKSPDDEDEAAAVDLAVARTVGVAGTGARPSATVFARTRASGADIHADAKQPKG
jgi:hypothetical protein